jgi:hypothetical protein
MLEVIGTKIHDIFAIGTGVYNMLSIDEWNV